MLRTLLLTLTVLLAGPCLAADFDLDEFYSAWLGEETSSLNALYLLDDDSLIDQLEPLAGGCRAELTTKPQDWRAAALLGLGYRFGKCGAPEDDTIARNYLLRAWRHGPPEAGYFVAYYSIQRAVWLDDPFLRDRAKLDCLRMQGIPSQLIKAADSGFAPAQALAAHLYFELDVDPKKATSWLKSAAKTVCRPAKLWLAWHRYQSGAHHECLKILNVLHEAKDAQGTYALACLHIRLSGPLAQVRKLYEESLVLGYTPAKWRLEALPEIAIEDLEADDIPELYRKGWQEADEVEVSTWRGMKYHVCPPNRLLGWYPGLGEWLEKQLKQEGDANTEVANYMKLALAEYVAYEALTVWDKDELPILPMEFVAEIDLDVCPHASIRAMEWAPEGADAEPYSDYLKTALLSDLFTAQRWYAIASVEDWPSAVYFAEKFEKDEREVALATLRQLAKAGDRLSASFVAKQARDETVRLEWHEFAAKLGEVESALYCARAYALGHGVETDAEKAEHWFSLAADASRVGSLRAAEVKAVIERELVRRRALPKHAALEKAALESLNVHGSFDEFLSANPRIATVGQRAHGKALLALCFLTGHGLTQDKQRALKLATSSEGVLQVYMTGWIHEHGLVGGKPFATGALDCYRSIKDQPAAMVRLGMINRDGDLTGQDSTKAAGYFLASAQAGCVPGMLEIAKAYRGGDGVSVDNKLAKQWAKKAADAGNEKAAKLLRQWK